MKKRPRRFIGMFFLSVMSALFCTFTVSWLVMGTLVRYFPEIFRHIWLVFIGTFLPWIFVGSFISKFFRKKLFEPIGKLNRVAKEIAEGNFYVRLEDTTNIIEVHEMAANFNLMAAELESTEIIHNDFIRNVSHEFKTPLSVIKGYSRMLQKDEMSDQERIRYALLIMENADRLSSMTNQILVLTKLENQQIQLDRHIVNIAEQIRNALLMLENQWGEKGLDLEIDMPEMVIYKGNEELLFQVWQNLIGNAIKFSHENGHIQICAAETKDSITVSFKDDGIGISPENQKRIFEKFYQADQSHAVAGNGLGLPLTKRIIELHGGTITVQSEEGRGSNFSVELPK